jgi:acyl-CoA synthetase (AMP-forming)/AMP-acid ligase II
VNGFTRRNWRVCSHAEIHFSRSQSTSPQICLEDSVDAHADRIAFQTDDGAEVSYAAFDAYANRVAHWAVAQGLEPGDTVALYMANRWEYVAIWFGLSKVGVLAALLNNQVTGKALAHGLNISEARTPSSKASSPSSIRPPAT